MQLGTRSKLSFRAPLDVGGLLRFFAARAVPGVEEVSETTYRRVVRLAHGLAVMELALTPARVALGLRGADPRDADEGMAVARRLLDLDADPGAVDALLGADPLLAPLVAACPGKRVPGAVHPFELAVRAVLGQQVTVVAARGLAGRIAAACGSRLPAPDGALTHAFPSPAELLKADPAVFAMPASRRAALFGLAAAWPVSDRDGLLALPGVGPWTAEYVAMRLGDRDAFLPTDVGVRNGLRALGVPHGPADAARRADRWRPYRAHAVLHLWNVPHTPARSGVPTT